MASRAGSSLTLRVIFFSSVWAVLALAVVGALISSLYERTAARGFQDLLTAQLYNLVNSVGVTEEGRLTGAPDLGDLRYAQPLSGWYWEVVPASPETSGRLSSPSMSVLTLPAKPVFDVPFDDEYRRSYDVPGPRDSLLSVVETEVVLDDANHVARFRVMGDRRVVDDDVTQFNATLFVYLGFVGIGTVLVNGLTLLYALRPLSAVRRSLAAVRNGQADRLSGEFPFEIEPLAAEMNALIDNSRRIVDRSRTQVGNLAHSLKTPIAILVNEGESIGGEHGKVVTEQSERLREQVQHYLDRARIAAQTDSVVYRASVGPALQRLVRVVAKLNPHLRFDHDEISAGDLVFAGEQQDYEEIVGNLLENAGKWARSKVRVRGEAVGADRFATIIEDDGPGLDEDEAQVAIKRGRRIDEAKPGSGLGLSIVADMVAEYRGTFDLGRSDLGGLRASILLPRAKTGKG